MPEANFLGGEGGSGVRDIAPPLLGNLGAKFSEMSFPDLRPILCKSAVIIFRQQFKVFDSNCFTVFNVLFPKCMAHKSKAVYT